MGGGRSDGLQDRARESAEQSELAGPGAAFSGSRHLHLPVRFAASVLQDCSRCFFCAGCCVASCADSESLLV